MDLIVQRSSKQTGIYHMQEALGELRCFKSNGSRPNFNHLEILEQKTLQCPQMSELAQTTWTLPILSFSMLLKAHFSLTPPPHG